MTAQLAILGLLVEQPLHGYGIERLIEERGMRNWTPIGFSSIYQMLDQLVQNGWAEVAIEPAPARGKERRVHHITDDGRRHWETQALSALADVDADPGSVLMALSGLPFLDPAAATEGLEQRAYGLDSRLDELHRDLAAACPVPPHVEAMFSFVESRLTGERDWVRSYLADITGSATEQENTP